MGQSGQVPEAVDELEEEDELLDASLPDPPDAVPEVDPEAELVETVVALPFLPWPRVVLTAC